MRKEARGWTARGGQARRRKGHDQHNYLNIYNIYNTYTSTRARSGKTGGIPVFALVDLKKNRDFMRLKQDIDASI